MSKIISFKKIMRNIEVALEEIDPYKIADIHNHICAKKVEAIGGGWVYTGVNDCEINGKFFKT